MPAMPMNATALRRHLLLELTRRGPVALSSLPRRWPLTRAHLVIAGRQLVHEGLASREVDPRTGRPDQLHITEAGMVWLRADGGEGGQADGRTGGQDGERRSA